MTGETPRTEARTVLLTGATGFIGQALDPLIDDRGWDVRRASRRVPRGPSDVQMDVADADSVERALEGCEAALYLIHRLDSENYVDEESRAAEVFVRAAERAGLRRLVYLGGVAPQGPVSKHLASRLRTGEILRSGRVSTIELRAGMVIGPESASWLIVRDLAARLPVMLLPRWLSYRSSPVALDDVLLALVHALDDPLEGSRWFDLPGPEFLSGREILTRVAALFGRRPIMVPVPLLSPRLSAHWLRFVTRSDSRVAAQLVEGLRSDLIGRGVDYWTRMNERPKLSFDEAARTAIAEDDALGPGERFVEAAAHALSRHVEEED